MTLASWQFLGCLVAALVIIWAFYGRLVGYVLGGQPVHAALSVVFISPVMLALVVTYGENRSLSDFTHLSHEPWSLLFGDTFALAGAAAIAAYGIRRSQKPIVVEPWQMNVCLAAGLLAGLGFHAWDAGNYQRMGLSSLAVAASKVYHDLVIYPVLFGAFMLITIVVVRHGSGTLRIAYLVCLAVWLVLAVRDSTAGLNPRDFHTACGVGCGLHNANGHLQWLNPVVSWLRSVAAGWHLV